MSVTNLVLELDTDGIGRYDNGSLGLRPRLGDVPEFGTDRFADAAANDAVVTFGCCVTKYDVESRSEFANPGPWFLFLRRAVRHAGFQRGARDATGSSPNARVRARLISTAARWRR